VKLNKLGILVGPSEYGKSTIVRGEVVTHLASHPRSVAFVHDPHGEYAPDLCTSYESPDAARAALQAMRPGLSRGFSVRGKSSQVRDLAIEVGKRSNKKDNVRVPVLLAHDESSLMNSSGKTHMSDEDLDLCSNRRHYGVYALLNVQTVRALTEGWFSNATDVWILSQQNEDDARELEKRIGLGKGMLMRSRIWKAPPFKFLHWRRGEGMVNT
jgi:hypothetical protein